MLKLLTIFCISLLLAYVSDKNTKTTLASGRRYVVYRDWAFVVLVVFLVFFAGLRTSYNDTWNYITGFKNAPTLSELWLDPDTFNIFKNPLFCVFRSTIKTLFNDHQIMIFLSSVVTQTLFMLFLKRYSKNFVFSIFLYFTLGTFTLTLAALKQVLAMAIMTTAFPALEKKKWIRYYLIVFIAMLFHTYALIFAFLPLFKIRPWKPFTYLFLVGVAVVMLTFEETITAFMDQANEVGKGLADYEVFSDVTINLFRLAVYAVPPLISLIFQKWVTRKNTGMDNVLIHMSVISFAFMLLGTQAGANMFGRMGNYFELGTLCCLPSMLKKTFSPEIYRIVSCVACVCFMGFFVYANALNGNFDMEYRAITLWEFLF